MQSFAITREASRRVLNMRPYDVQLNWCNGFTNDGRIAEMKTGEGKTLLVLLCCIKCLKWKRCSCCYCK